MESSWNIIGWLSVARGMDGIFHERQLLLLVYILLFFFFFYLARNEHFIRVIVSRGGNVRGWEGTLESREDMTFYDCDGDRKVEAQRQMVLNKSSQCIPSRRFPPFSFHPYSPSCPPFLRFVARFASGI